jgi:hypothetical protein
LARQSHPESKKGRDGPGVDAVVHIALHLGEVDENKRIPKATTRPIAIQSDWAAPGEKARVSALGWD